MVAISHQPPQSPLMKTPTHQITMQYSARALINQSTPVKNGESEILDVVFDTDFECFGTACNQTGRTEFFSRKKM